MIYETIMVGMKATELWLKWEARKAEQADGDLSGFEQARQPRRFAEADRIQARCQVAAKIQAQRAGLGAIYRLDHDIDGPGAYWHYPNRRTGK